MSIVYENIITGDTVLANLNDLQAETFLYKAELLIGTKDQRFTVSHIDGTLLSAGRGINGVMAAVIEDDTVLQNLAYGSSLMLISSLENGDCLCIVAGNTACEEVTTRTETKLSRMERILRRTVRT